MKSIHSINYPRHHSKLLLACMLVPSISVAATGNESSPFWSSIMILIVLAVAASSAMLPISAYRYWKGYWKLVAALPILVLAGWSAWIIVARLIQPTAHAYWMLEIFAWAMLALLYMATMMTAKRQFEKADNPEKS